MQGEPSSGSVHLRFPQEVYERLKHEATAEQLPLTYYVYRLVVQRPERIVHSKRDKARIAALEQEVKQLKTGAESDRMQLDETIEPLRKAEAEKEQMMVNTHRYIIKQEANTKAFQARIRDLEYWENFGKAVIFAAQNREEIKTALMSIPLVAGMLRGARSP